MSVIRKAIKEKDLLEEKYKSTSSDYNRFRLLEELINDYKKDSKIDCDTFADVYYGSETKPYTNSSIRKEYNLDYYANEV